MSHRRSFAVIAASAVVLLASFAGTSAASAATSRSGTLSIEKNCAGFSQTPPYCTVTVSDTRLLPVDTKITYLDPAASFTPAGGGVVITLPKGESTAFGVCTISPVTLGGVCTVDGGTGRFTGFHADMVVTWLGGDNWSWAGPYSFTPAEDDD